MGAMSPTHWLIVIGVLLVLFGAKKLPDMARSVGQSARVFKGEMKGLREDQAADEAPAVEQAATVGPVDGTRRDTSGATGDRTAA